VRDSSGITLDGEALDGGGAAPKVTLPSGRYEFVIPNVR
jgi:hypothetical protein